MSDIQPDDQQLILRGHAFDVEAVITGLAPYVSEVRQEKMRRVIAGRTNTIVPVLEGLFDRGNVSAVVRSAEAMGYQSIHIIELTAKFKKAQRVTQGAEKWLDLHKWEATADCIANLRESGHRILAAHVDDAQDIDDFSFDEPTAIFFGNEHAGLSEEALAAADARVKIPMEGFTQSFNISVAAALTLAHIRADRNRRGRHADLSTAQQRRMLAEYFLRSVDTAEGILLRELNAASP